MSTNIQFNMSTETNELFSQVCDDENLSCTICLVPFTNPHILQKCSHAFCKACIDVLPKQECPTCRKPFKAKHVMHDFDKQSRVDKVRTRCINAAQSQSTKTSTPNSSAITQSQPPQNPKTEDDNVKIEESTVPNPVLQHQSEVINAVTRPQKLACIAKMIFASYQPNAETHFNLEGITTSDEAINAIRPVLQSNHIESLKISGCDLNIIKSQLMKILSEKKSLHTLVFTNLKGTQPCTISIKNLYRIINLIKINRSLITLDLSGITIRNDKDRITDEYDTFMYELVQAFDETGNRSITKLKLPYSKLTYGTRAYDLAAQLDNQLIPNKNQGPTSIYKGTLQAMKDAKDGEKYEKLKKQALLYLEKGVSVHTNVDIGYVTNMTILHLAIDLFDADLVFHLLTNDKYRANIYLKDGDKRDPLLQVRETLTQYTK